MEMGNNIDRPPHSGRCSLNVLKAASSTNKRDECINDQDQLLPIANIGRIMKQALPPNAKISKEAKETVQECVSEFIGFITGEASHRCCKEKRKTINGDDLHCAMKTLGLDEYADATLRYLQRYRENAEKETSRKRDKSIQIDVIDELSVVRNSYPKMGARKS